MGALWALPILALATLRRRRPAVEEAAPLQGPLLSVVIPARNESVNIDQVLESLQRSCYRDLEIVVVDDRSTDDTAERVARRAATDPRLRLVPGQPLPPGWFGKPWALTQGATAARGEILCFVDADTTLHPDLLPHAVGALHASEADLYTLSSRLRCESLWERLVMPQVWIILALRYTPARVNRARRPDDVVANGQFIMMTRRSHEAIGGHAAVHDQVVEDLALAQRCVTLGLRLRMEFGEAMLATRMYRDLPGLVEGWSKNLFVGARQSLRSFPRLQPFAPLFLLGAFGFWLVPLLVLLPLGLTGAAIVAVCASLCFWALALAGMRIPPGYALGYPLGAAMAMWIAARSTLRGTRRITWRGRDYGPGS